MKKLFLSLIILLGFLFKVNAQQSLNELKNTYKTALSDWNVPGMAVAIIKNDSLVLSQGFGIRDIDSKEKVTDETLFAIASNTKAFTAAGLGILVDEGKLSWDDKVTKHLPWFRMYDPYVTHEMTVRDLLCHRSGLKTFSGDLLWFGSEYSRREIVERARHLEPAYGFREQFGYSNIMYLAAGLIIEEISGRSWDEFMYWRIFKPLEMGRTITTTYDLEHFEDVATPHNQTDSGTIAIDYLNWDNIAPAGGIISCVKDVKNWLTLQLNHGVFEGDTIFSHDVQKEMWAQHTPLNVSDYSRKMFPSTHFKSYGLGWSVSDYGGKKIVTHNGGYDGMISQTVLIPEENSAFVILTNSLSGIYQPMMYTTLDFLLGRESKDWNSVALKRHERYEKHKEKQQAKKDSSRKQDTSPSFPLQEYTGTYNGELYGPVKVSIENGQLKMQMVPSPKFHSTMEHWHYDTFNIKFEEFPSLPRGWVNFIMDQNGKINEMRIDVPNPDFDFTELKLYKK